MSVIGLRKRINRKTYFVSLLISNVFIAGIALVAGIFSNGNENFQPLLDIPLLVLLIALIWFNICIARQRSNDISGEYSLLWLFFTFFLIGPIIGFIPGEKVVNKFGPPPPNFNYS